MRKGNSALVAFFMAVLVSGMSSYAQQTYREALRRPYVDSINSQLKNVLQMDFTVGHVTIVDLDLGKRTERMDYLEDPYGTLHGCILFSASPEENRYENNMVGVFKNGSILWHSDTTIYGRVQSFAASHDMNLDGRVEFTVLVWDQDGLESMKIYSWDGLRGWDISDSTISGSRYSLTIDDADGDGILEVIDTEDGQAEVTTWSWNGVLYGKWPNSPRFSRTTFFPARNAEAKVSCHVSSSDASGVLLYSYSLQNLPSSKRRIESMFLEHGLLDTTGGAPEGWYFAGGRAHDLFIWEVDPRALATLMPRPGETLNGLWTRSLGLPRIAHYYVQSERTQLSADTVDDRDNYWANVHSNSYSERIVAPFEMPSPFKPLDLFDSLSSWVRASRSLMWISSQQVTDKYVGYFSLAKSQLQTGNVSAACGTLGAALQDVSIDSASTLSSEAYALIRFNTEYLLAKLAPSRDVKGGLLFTPEGGTNMLILEAKPAIAFTPSDTLIALAATIRWPIRFGVSLGSVSSPYGFTKIDTPITIGSYRYQKFATSQKMPLSWQAGSEYELFSVPVTGMCGAETFELSSALAGGEWFVDINYLDKTDSLFYAPTAQGYAYANLTDNSYSTFANGQRHIVRSGGKLHEAYVSGTEVIYRRSSDDGASWEITSAISSGSNGSTCLASGAGNMLYCLWERPVSSSNLEIWFTRSSDNGGSWSHPVTLPGATGLVPGYYQANRVSPVIAELPGSPAHLICAFADQAGLKYQRSTDQGQTWMGLPVVLPPTVKGASDGANIWYLSIAPGTDYLMLTYDYRVLNPQLTSRVYTAGGGWSAEAVVCAGTGTTYDRHSSVAIDDFNNAVVSWCAQKMVGGSLDADYRIMVREGTRENSWSSYFVEFPKTQGIWDMYPSVALISAAYSDDGQYRVVFQRNNGEVRVVTEGPDGGYWNTALLDSSGQWVNSSLECSSGNTAKLMYTDLSSVNGLYPVVVTSSSGTPVSGLIATLPGERSTLATGTSASAARAPSPLSSQVPSARTEVLASLGAPLSLSARELILDDPLSKTSLIYTLKTLTCVRANGETVALPFKKADSLGTLSSGDASLWGYLGTEASMIPSDASSLLLDLEVRSETAPADTVAKGGSLQNASTGGNSMLSSGTPYSLELRGTDGKVAHTLYQNTQGTGVSMSFPLPGSAKGKTMSLRVAGSVPDALKGKVTVGVGDVLAYTKP